MDRERVRFDMDGMAGMTGNGSGAKKTGWARNVWQRMGPDKNEKIGMAGVVRNGRAHIVP